MKEREGRDELDLPALSARHSVHPLILTSSAHHGGHPHGEGSLLRLREEYRGDVERKPLSGEQVSLELTSHCRPD